MTDIQRILLALWKYGSSSQEYKAVSHWQLTYANETYISGAKTMEICSDLKGHTHRWIW